MILLHEPTLKGNEQKYLQKCISSNWISTSGKFINLFEKKIRAYTKAKNAVAVNSGTSALHISLLLSNTKPGDEVIVPTISFIAPINAVIYCKASPIFMDVDEHLNIDVKKTISFLKEKTITKNKVTYNKKTNKRISALIVVHVFGNLANIKPLVKICKEKNIDLIEDAAESFGSYYKNLKKKKHAGTVGKFGCLSFNGNKIITCGGGGMILTEKKELADKARYLITQAKNDQINFIHNEVGYNYRMSNLHAAVGVSQLEQIDSFIFRKKKIFDEYSKEIKKIEGLSIVKSPKYCKANNWINLIQVDKKKYKKNIKQLINLFTYNNIQARPVWYPNHLQKPYYKFERYNIRKAMNLVNVTLCLPSSVILKKSQIKKIVTLLKK
mgnify:FL=1